MKLLAAKLALVMAATPHPAKAASDHFTVEATAYTPCSSGSVMADGHRTYWGAVASNTHRMHALLRFDHRLFGRRYFRIRDHIGSGTQLDIWMPGCQQGILFGRRRIGYRVVGR